jgi:hypothetical protein
MTTRELIRYSQLILVLAALPHLLDAQSTVTLSTSPNPSRFGAPVVLSATVTPATATGRVTFYDGVTVLGTKPLVSGAASLSTILLPAGNRKLKAYYSGDASNAAATSNIVSQTVNAQPSVSFALDTVPAPGAFTVLAEADFNGDGKLDLAVTASNGLGFSILLGDGMGNFQVAFTGAAGVPIEMAAVGDFNGDGIPDFAYPVFNSSTVNILLGKGDGTFQPPASVPLPTNTPSSLTVGDFNGDGKLDIAAGDPATGVDILLGNGDGTFRPAVSYPAGPQGFGGPFIVVADFNGDGKADLATGPRSGSSNISILLGNGDGSFQAPTLVPAGNPIGRINVGDFNGDGKADLVTDGLSVLLGNGDGTFQKPVNYAFDSPYSLTVALGDFNGDGRTDLAVSSFPVGSLPNVRVLLGNGDGTFQSPVVWAPIPFGGPILVGDFNGDGRADLVGSGTSSLLLGSTVTVTPTAGTPQYTIISTAFPIPLQVTVKNGPNPVSGATVTFAAPTVYGVEASATFPSSTAITDANGVASATAIANFRAGIYSVTATALGVSAVFSLSNLDAPPSVFTASPAQQSALLGTAFAKPLQVTLTDSNGYPASGVTVQFSVPAGGASAVLSSATAVTNALGVASVTATANNTAGRYTVTATAAGLSTSFSLTNLQPVTVTLASSSNPSNLGAPVTLTATMSSPAATGRVTFFDGVAILETKTVSSGVASFSTVLLSAGVHKLTAYYRDDANSLVGTSNAVTLTVKAAAGGAFITQNPVGTPAGSSVAVGDFNHDGKVDIAFPAGFVVTVLLGKGDGTFQAPVDYPIATGGSATSIVAADFDGDGNTDLATSGGSILFGKGDGTFRPAVNNTAAGSPLAVGDFNGDGKPDIIYAFVQQEFAPVVFGPEIRPSPRDGYFYYVLNVNLQLGNGDGTFGSPILYASLAASSSQVFAGLLVADFNGDGKPDVVVLPSDAGPSIVLGNGDGTGQAPASISLGGFSPSNSLLAGDFNGDGKTDVVVGGLVLLGNGDGTFQPLVNYPLVRAVASGDFNGDGITDLVVANASGNTGILYGRGDGTFQQELTFSAGAPLAVTDFNGDGKADLLTSNGFGITVLLGATPSTGGGPPASITAIAGTPQSTLVDTAFPNALQASVKDPNGLPVGGATVTFTMPSTGASAILSTVTALTNASGVASVTATANNIPGTFAVTASVAGFSTSFPLTNLLGNFNLAQGKTASQSSTFPGYAAAGPASALDGNTDGSFSDGSVTATNLDTNAWWQVDLGATTAVGSVVIWNRTDCCGTRLNDFWVFISNTPFLPTDTPSTLQNRAGTFSSHQTSAPNPSTLVAAGGAIGRYVRVQLSGANYLSLAEVQVFAGTNLALNKPATQSTNYYSTSVAGLAVDGNTDGNFFDGSVALTASGFPNAWWQVDLGASATVSSVVVWNRTDACCISQLSDFWVFVSDTPFSSLDTPATLQNRAGTFSSHQTSAPNPSTAIVVQAQGRYVRVQLSGQNFLGLAEVQVFGTVGPAPMNIAQGKLASQSSTFPGYASASASSAVDGSTDGNFGDGSVTATNADPNAWWQVDLGASAGVSSIVVWNRSDCCGSRLGDYWVFVSDTPFLPTDTPATLQNRPLTFSSHQGAAPNPSTTIAAAAQGRYVRVQLSGTDYLSLAEVQVFGVGGAPAPTNVALGKAATQSSTLPGYATDGAAAAVDGSTDGNFFDGSVTATNLDPNAWWQVDLGASTFVSSILIFNRTDCCGSRLNDYWVFVSDTPFLASDTPATLQNRPGTFSSHQTAAPNPSTTIAAGAQGRYVRVQLTGANYLSLAEVQVFGQ